MPPFLDFHTHAKGCQKQLDHDDVIVVQSLHLHEKPHPRANYATYGIHPMLEGAREVLQKYIAHPSDTVDHLVKVISSSTTPIIGIGECGWDRRSPLSLTEQNQLLDLHLEISLSLGLPIIFHIVGAWHHLLACRKREKGINTPPWIVHGFRGKQELAMQLTQAGILLSLHPQAPHLEGIEYFLETDDSPHSIQDIYQAHSCNNDKKKEQLIKLFYTIMSSHINK